jgi:hydroxymethylpyrimidine/phosphomethylpyrimidine kinase
MQNQKPILTITGSDPAGGSGIQADIRTISALGGYAVSAITSLTVQNTLGIQEFHDLPASVVQGQVEAIMNDVEPETVKIGMIRTPETLQVIIDLLLKYRPRHVIYVPLMSSAQGERLIPVSLAGEINQRLVPLCTMIIPFSEFQTHGEANIFASAAAYYLNEGSPAGEALRRAHQWLDAQAIRPSGLTSRSSELYQLFMRQLEQHFRTNSDVSFYADRLNVATGYLAQVTRRAIGLSPKAIIDERIASEAARLLTSTSLTVQEIANQLSFSSQAHFTKFFRKRYGKTPTRYRKEIITDL